MMSRLRNILFNEIRRSGAARRRPQRSVRSEQLEPRVLLSASPVVEARAFPFTLSGSYTGQNPGTYNSTPSNTQRNYLDTFTGSLTATGTMQYSDNLNGTGSIQLIAGAGTGRDTFWEDYDYVLRGSLQVVDNGGHHTVNLNGKRDIIEPSIKLRTPNVGGNEIKPKNPNAVPQTMTGDWSSETYDVTLSDSSPFSFTGRVTPTITGPTDIVVTTVDASHECVEIDVSVTGAFPRVANTAAAGYVLAEWVGNGGETIATIFDQPVYWNTGSVKLKADLAAPEGTVRVRVSATIAGDSNDTNNWLEDIYEPNLKITDFAWDGDEDGGVIGSYQIEGANLSSESTIGLYWSADETFDSGDGEPAFVFPTRTQASKPGEKFPFPPVTGTNIKAPEKHQKYLLAVIDSENFVEECNEDDNEQAQLLKVRLTTEISVNPGEALKNVSYEVLYSVRNESPVQLTVDIVRDWTSPELTMGGLEQRRDEKLLLKPGEEAQWTETKTHINYWEWVDKESPIKFGTQNALLWAVALDIVAALPGGGVYSTIETVIGAIFKSQEILAIRNTPHAQLTHVLDVVPYVKDAAPVSAYASQILFVGQKNVDALIAFKTKALATTALLGGIAEATSHTGVGNTLSVIAGYLYDAIIELDGSWKAVYDPPDPEFDIFPAVTIRTPDLAGLDSRQERASALRHAIDAGFQRAVFATIDKSDGALIGGDVGWYSQQLANLSSLLQQQTFARIHAARLVTYLAPWHESRSATPELSLAYWQTHDFPSEISDVLAEAGLSNSEKAELLAVIRDISLDDFASFGPDVESTMQRAAALVSAGQAMEYLKQSISVRVNKLQLPVRSLTTVEEQTLANYRSVVQSRQASNDYGGDFPGLITEFTGEIQRLAFATNNFEIFKSDLDLAFLALVHSGAASTSTSHFGTVLADFHTAGDVSPGLYSRLVLLTSNLEFAIRNGEFDSTAGWLDALQTELEQAPGTDVTNSVRQLLLNRIDALRAVDHDTPAFSQPSLTGLAGQRTLTERISSVLGTDVSTATPGPGTFVGGQVVLTVGNPRIDSRWIFDDGDPYELVEEDEIAVRGVPVARVIVSTPEQLELQLLADAAPGDVQFLLRAMKVDLPTAQNPWSSSLTVELRNGVGGSTSHVMELSRPAGVPEVPGNDAPSGITLTASSVFENRLPGTVVGSFVAVDDDPGDAFVFSLVDGAGANDNQRFQIVGNQLRTNERLDFEGQSQHSVRVRVSDKARLVAEQILLVTVIDVAEAPESILLSADSVLENQPSGTVVGQLSASYTGIGPGGFTFTFPDGPGNEYHHLFLLSGSTVSTASEFDFESQRQYGLTVRVTDTAGLSFDQRLYVRIGDVNESPIDLTLTHGAVLENLPVGSSVGSFALLDSEPYGLSQFELIAGEGDDDNQRFVVDFGQLRTAEVFNFESKKQYTIRVRGTDFGGLAIERVFAVLVEDVNDVPTEIRFSTETLQGRLSGGVIVGRITGVDVDQGDALTYELTPGIGSENNYSFEIVGDLVRINRQISDAPQTALKFRIRAVDLAGAFVEQTFQLNVLPDPSNAVVGLISKSAGEVGAEAGLGWDAQSISADGRFTVFTSSVSHLVAETGFTSYSQVYLRDNVLGTLVLISRSVTEASAGNSDSSNAQISSDGRIITFLSSADDLIAGGFAGPQGLYIHDVTTGQTRLVSHRSGQPLHGINDEVYESALSQNGTKIAFLTYATDVIAGIIDDNSASDLFLYDVQTDSTTLITHRGGDPLTTANGSASSFQISGDGMAVVFETSATDLAVGVTDTNDSSDLFLFRVETGTSAIITASWSDDMMASDGTSLAPSISYDGQLVAYSSYATDITEDMTEYSLNIFLYDAVADTNLRVTGQPEVQATSVGQFSNARISSDGTVVVFDSFVLFPDYTGFDQQVYAYFVSTQDTMLVSHSATNETSGGNGLSFGALVSANGELIVYSSTASDIVDGVLNVNGDLALYAFNMLTGATTLVTHRPEDGLAVPEGFYATAWSIAANGSSVILSSPARLVADVFDTSHGGYVYLYSVSGDQISLVSHYESSQSAFGRSSFLDMSADGRFVLFESDAPNLVPGQSPGWIWTEGDARIFLADRVSGTTVLVSHEPGQPNVAAAGTVLAGQARISADGSAVVYAFFSYETYQSDVMRFDVHTGVTTLVSRAAGTSQSGNGDSGAPRISDNGRIAVFESNASDLIAGLSVSGERQLYAYDFDSGLISLISHRFDVLLAGANGESLAAEISGDGTRVVFLSDAIDLVSNGSTDTNDATDVFVYEIATGRISLVSHAIHSQVSSGNGTSSAPSISSDGMWIAFQSDATDIPVGGAAVHGDVYVHEVATGANRLVSHRHDDSMMSTGEGASNPRISENGKRVVFEAYGTDLIADAYTSWGSQNIYVYDIANGQNVLVSHIDLDVSAEANYHSFHADISGDGSTVVWMTWANDVLKWVTDWNSRSTGSIPPGDVYRYSVDTGRNTLLSRTFTSADDTADGDSTTGNSWASQGRLLSYDGSAIAFESLAANVTSGDRNRNRDVFVAEYFELLVPGSVTLDGVTIEEHLPAGTPVGQLSAVDRNAGGPVSFALVSGQGDNDNSSFTITPDARLMTTASFDAETRNHLTIRVRATDASGMFTDVQFTIFVIDTNEPELTLADVRVIEGNSGQRNLTFTISLSQSSQVLVSVDVRTQDSSAAVGQDYEALPRTTITFAPGETTQTVSIIVFGDTVHEGDEDVLLLLSNSVNAKLARWQGTGTILNDDATDPPVVSINDVTVNEGAGTATFTVSLSAVSGQTVTVDYATADGTAQAGSDYTALATTTLTFNPGETSTTITVAISEDLLDESSENFTVNLSNASNATISDGLGVGTITDNDVQSLLVSPMTLSVAEGSTNTFTVRLAVQPAANVIVSIAWIAGDTDLTVSGGGSLTFTTANWNTLQTVTLAAAEDVDLANGSAVFDVTSSGLSPVSVTGTEADNDAQSLVVSSTAVSVTEGLTNSFSVKLAFQPATDVTVSVARTSGDTDLSVSGGASLTFTTANWNTPQTVTLAAAEDADLANGSAVFDVTSSGLSTVSVTGTEADNDFAPTDILLSDNNVQENAGPNAVVGTLFATDENSGETFTFSLPVGVGDNAAFNISGTSLRASASFDFETKSSYSVTVRVTDSGGLTFDKVFTIGVTNLFELNGIDVQNGQTQRSFVRYLDLVFDSDMGLLDLINNGRLQLTKFDLNGANGLVIPLPDGAGTSVSGTRINVDFGAQGIGGNRNSAVGDGYYEIGVDMDGNGSFETKKHFFRLFGDVTGDGTVDSDDKIKVLQGNGTTSSESDINGDGLVNVLDTALMSRAIGKKIKNGLFWDD